MLAWPMHGSVSSIVIIDISVTTGPIDVILESLPVLTEVGDGGFFDILITAKLAVTSLILIDCEHLLVVGI